MDDLNEIKDIWLTANLNSLPTAEEVVKAIKRYQYREVIKRVAVLLLALIAAAIMIHVIVSYHSNMLTTRIGEDLMFTAVLMALVVNTKSLTKVIKWKNFTNSEFIGHLKQKQQRLLHLNKRVQTAAFALVSVGLLLYVFEMVHTNLILMVVSYLLLSIWILVNWFVVRPMALRKKTKALTKTIERLENLSTQFLND